MCFIFFTCNNKRTYGNFYTLQPQNQQQTPSKNHVQPLSHQPQFHHIHQNHHQPIHQGQHPAHFSQNHQCGPPPHLPEIAHAQQSPTISQHMPCLQPLTGGHVAERLHVMVRVSFHMTFSQSEDALIFKDMIFYKVLEK